VGRYLARRLLIALPTLVGAATASFILVRLIPGDPARVMLGPNASPGEIAQFRSQLGLDQSIWYQYFSYMGRLFRGDFGNSAASGRPVIDEIGARAVNTVELAVAAMILALIIGCLLGMVAALKRDTIWDVSLSGISVAGVSMPVYWIGLLLVIVFAIDLHWLPSSGSGSWQHLVLPAVTLSFFAVGFLSRQTRSAMVDIMEQDFVRSLRAKGLSQGAVVVRHALRNASLPIVTVAGLQFGQMLGGAIVTETIFAWPGLGQLLVNSINARDYVTVQGLVFVFAATLILINLLTDFLYAYLDPRIKYD
jgi:peptide/nickel transport system permease protein